VSFFGYLIISYHTFSVSATHFLLFWINVLKFPFPKKIFQLDISVLWEWDPNPRRSGSQSSSIYGCRSTASPRGQPNPRLPSRAISKIKLKKKFFFLKALTNIENELLELKEDYRKCKQELSESKQALQEFSEALSESKLRMVELKEEIMPLSDAKWIKDKEAVQVFFLGNYKFFFLKIIFFCSVDFVIFNSQ